MGQGTEETEPSNSAVQPDDKPGLYSDIWKTQVWRLFPLLSIYVISLTLLMPLKPNLMTDFFASRHSRHYIHCEDYAFSREPRVCQDAHSSVVTLSSVSDFVSNSIMLFIFAPLVGKWSDVYGRKPFLMLTFVCASCTILVLFLNLNFGVSMFFYFPAQAINGCLSSISICMAYVSDRLHPENRAPTFGLIICSFSVGILVGPLGGGYIPPPVASILALSGMVFCVLYVLLLIPESVTAEKALQARQKQRDAPLHLQGPFQGFAILFRSKLFTKLTICVMFTGIVAEGMYELITQYLQIKLNFSATDLSHMFVLAGVCGMVTQLLILRLLIRFVGKSGMLLVGLSASVIQQTLMIFVWNKPIGIFAVCLGSIGNLSFPAISTIKSLNVAESEQGTMQGALSGARALAQGTGPLIFAGLFSLFTQSWSPFPYFPGAPFIFGAVMLFMALVLACTIDREAAEHGSKPAEGSVHEPLLDPERGLSEAEEVKQPPLPEDFVCTHMEAGILMDITPENACEALLPGALTHGTIECNEASAHAREASPSGENDIESGNASDETVNALRNDGITLGGDVGEVRTPLGHGRGHRPRLDPKDSASSQRDLNWKEYLKQKEALNKVRGQSEGDV